MNETQLWELLSDIESALRTTAAITDAPMPIKREERDRVIEERAQLYEARDGLATAHRVLTKVLADQLCGRHSYVGSVCTRHTDHSGAHRSVWGATWTNHSDYQFGLAYADKG